METSIESCCYLVLFLLMLYVLKTLIFFPNNKKHPLPPSPGISLPLIGHLYLFKKPLHQTFAKLTHKYGPIIFLQFGSRPVVVVSSPAAVEECLGKNDIVFANRPRLLAGKYIGYNYTTLSSASYGDHWRNLRRIASIEILSSNRVNMMYPIRLDEVRSVVRRLFQGFQGDGYQIVEMKSLFFELTLNVMMRMISGKRYYGEGATGLKEEIREFKEIVRETFLLSGATNIIDYVPVLKWVGLNGIEKKMMKLQGRRRKFMGDLIKEQRRINENDSFKEKRTRKTMIDVLLTLQETEPEYYTDDVISGLMQVMLSAGTDTSAGTIEWAMSLLLNNPETILQAQAEIDKHIEQSRRLIEESDLTMLPYLQAIIKETLRMYGGPMLLPHESSKECIVGGYRVPRGTMLLVNMWAIQNDPKLWEDPRSFRPERWLKGEDEGYVLPFGVGRRKCPGEGLAMRMLGFVLGSLIQCFEWERPGEEMVDMTEGTGITLPKALPLVAKIKPRQGMVSLLSQL